jgi:hypothetical protein
LNLLFAPFLPILAFPPLAFPPAVVFGACYYCRRSSGRRGGKLTLLLPAAAWAAYGVYEIRMYYWSKTVVAPIRIDLLLIVPVLYLILAVGIWACYRSRRSPILLDGEPTRR